MSVLVVCLAGLNAAVLQIRCVDAAREAARLAARGDDGVAAARRVGPAGAVVSVHRDGGWSPEEIAEHAMPAFESSFFPNVPSLALTPWDPI